MTMTCTYTHVRCDHPADKVWADILHGTIRDDSGNVEQQVQWCSRCGAYRFTFGNPHDGSDLRYSDWQEPELDRIAGEGIRV